MTRRTFIKLGATALSTLFLGLPSSQEKEDPSVLKTVLRVEKGLWSLFRAEYYIKNILFAGRAAKRIVEKVKEVFA